MRLDDERESTNVEDRRGAGGFGGGRGATIGIGTIVVAFAASYFFGIDPRVILEGASALQGRQQQAQPAPAQRQGEPANDTGAVFTRKVLGNIERTWTGVFNTQLHAQYQPPTLVMFTNSTPTACGTGQTAMGPFYCPGDRKDTSISVSTTNCASVSRGRRFCAGLRDRARGRPSRAEPARHFRQGRRRAGGRAGALERAVGADGAAGRLLRRCGRTTRSARTSG